MTPNLRSGAKKGLKTDVDVVRSTWGGGDTFKDKFSKATQSLKKYYGSIDVSP